MPLDAAPLRDAGQRGDMPPGRPRLRFRIDPQSFGFTVLLGALSALTPLSIDMGLPALPELASSLHANAAAASLTLSLYVAGFALAQLIFGPLSGRFGRRPVLLAGCIIFSLAAIATTASSSIGAVVLWRFAQGAGGGATTALAMAVVRDLYEGGAARARLSYVMMVLTVSPIVAPTIGGFLLPLGGWRLIYAAMAAAGCLLTLAVLFGLDESNRAPDAAALRPARLFANYRRALGSRACLGYSLVGGLSMGCLFSYITASPLVLLGTYGVSTQVYGVLFGLTAGGIMLGAWVAGQLATRGVRGGIPVAWGLGIAATTALLLLAASIATPVPSLAIVVPLLVANTFCIGLMGASITHAAIEGLPQIAGIAAAVVGCIRMLGAAASSAVVGALVPALGMRGLPVTMALFACAALAVWWFYARTAPRAPVPAGR